MTTTHNTKADLLALISTLEAKVTQLEHALEETAATKKRGAKPVVEKVAKPYAGKQGHYFMMQTSAPGYQVMADRVVQLLEQEEFATKIRKSQLGRAMIQQFETTGDLFFWSPNQNDLMFGPVLPGRDKAVEAEIFVIPAVELTDLGKAFADDKAGKVAVEALVNLPGFLALEKLQNEERKLQEKLNKLNENSTK